MIAFFLFVVIPFIIGGMVGVRNSFAVGAFLVAGYIILGFGFVTGLGLSFIFLDESYFKNYQLISMWTNTLVLENKNLQFWQLFSLPTLLFIDLFRVYLHFSITNGNILLWIPEAMSWYVVYMMIKFSGLKFAK